MIDRPDASPQTHPRRRHRRVYEGRWATLMALLAGGLVVCGALFATVHKAAPIQGAGLIPMFMVWINHGYFKHGGLRFFEPVDANPTQRVWRSSSMAYMQTSHLVQRVHVLLRGRPSYRLQAIHNQAIVWLASALLGLLAFRIVAGMGVDPPQALLLGFVTGTVYQTFPSNLNTIISPYPALFVTLGLIVFLILELRATQEDAPPPWCSRARTATAFAMFYCDPISSGLFTAFYALLCGLLAPEVFRRYRFVPTIVVPAAVAVGLFSLQLAWVSWRYPGVQLFGSPFMFRSGFDGSMEYYRTHADLILGRFEIPWGPQLRYLAQWWPLMIGGVLAVGWIVAAHVRAKMDLRRPVYVLLLGLTMYLPFAFLFSQATILHPWIFDQYFSLPLVLASFAVLPAMIGIRSRRQGLLTYVAVLAAFCYVMVQLRMFATIYPGPVSGG